MKKNHQLISTQLLSIKGVISKEDKALISPEEKATHLTTAIFWRIKSSPNQIQDVLNAKLSLPDDTVETLWSAYAKDTLTSAFSSADPDTVNCCFAFN